MTVAPARGQTLSLPNVLTYGRIAAVPALVACLFFLKGDIARWSAYAKATGKINAAGLQIDSGLNRLGVPAVDLSPLAADPDRVKSLGLKLVMSHLASADNPADLKNRDQLLAFETLSALIPNMPRSLAASDGLMLGRLFHFDLVRPGYALYGGQASLCSNLPRQRMVESIQHQHHGLRIFGNGPR